MASQSVKTKTETDVSVDSTACPECNGDLVIDDVGDRICDDCGLVYDDTNIDRGPEWRNFDDGLVRRNPSRVGAPVSQLYHDKGLSTQIGSVKHDGNGNSISTKKKKKMRRLRKWDSRHKIKSSERGLRFALTEIERMGSALGLSDGVRQTAAVLYRQCFDEDIIVGFAIEAVATACLYISARQYGVPRTLKEFYVVCRLSGGSGNDNPHITLIGRVYREIVSELGLTMDLVDPEKYLDRYITELDLDNRMDIRDDALKFIEAVKSENKHSGVRASSLAATAVYCSAGINDQYRTQLVVCDVSDLSVETLRNRYQEFCDVVGIDTSQLKHSGCVDIFD